MIAGMRLHTNRPNMARIVMRLRYVFLQAIFLTSVAGEGMLTDLRLTGGPSPYEGTVEYRINNGNWETTCGINLSIKDVILICKHLGYTGANRAITDSPFNVSDDTPSSLLFCDGGKADVIQCGISSPISCTGAGAAVCYDKSYQGCFEDMKNDRVLPGNPCPDGGQQSSSVCESHDLTIRTCINICSSDTAYVFAGVENGKECFCGLTDTDYSRHGRASDEECHTACSGNMYESCGGVGHIAVFKIYPGTSALSTEMSSQPLSSIMTSESGASSTFITESTSPATFVYTSSADVTPTSSSNPGSPNGSKRNVVEIAGAGAGGAAIVILFIIIVIVALRRKNKRKDAQPGNDREANKKDSQNDNNMINANKKTTGHGLSEKNCESTFHLEDSDHVGLYAVPEKSAKTAKDNDGMHANSPLREPDGNENPDGTVDFYAVPHKSRNENILGGEGTHEDVSALYSVPDKKRNGHADEDDDSMMMTNELYSCT